MFTINNQPYIDLDPYIDIAKLYEIEKSIALGIAKSTDKISDAGCMKKNFYPNEFQKDKKSLLDLSLIKEITNPANENYE